MKFLAATVQRRRVLPSPVVDWAPHSGRELGSERLPDTPADFRVVACLNVWNDRPALERTVPTWYDAVDAVVAVDGAYPTTEARALVSTDGTRDFLGGLPKVTLLDRPGATQLEKRTAYLDALGPGDVALIVDADEALLEGGTVPLSTLPMLDVGWVRIASALYAHRYGQPRLIRWHPGLAYRGRHHWIYAGDRLLATHQYGGVGFEHRVVPLALENRRGLGHTHERKTAKRRHLHAQMAVEARATADGARTAKSDATMRRREPLHIVMAALRDDGLAPSRLHTALNRTTPHSSLLFKAQPGPFGVPEQYSATRDARLFAHAVSHADVVHCHVAWSAGGIKSSKHRWVVLHHHGTYFRRHVDTFTRQAVERRALVLVSNLELLTYAPTAKYLPNVVPVARYRRLVSQAHRTNHDTFRVAHSPSHRSKKGTAEFERVCAALKARGYPIEPVLVGDGTPHADVLAAKAMCDAAFDSFWLGLQCSGLEAAAMGLPVIAGDDTVAERMRARYGEVPYTFADSEEQLEAQLVRLMDDAEFRYREAERVSQHVLEHHDESAVALLYLDYIDDAFGWRA